MRNALEDILQRILERTLGQIRCTASHALITTEYPCLRCGSIQ